MELCFILHPVRKKPMKHISINIPSPCSQNWSGFTSTVDGAFCPSCNKNVVDLTAMSDAAVTELVGRTRGNLCVRAHRDQLKANVLPAIHIRPGLTFLRAGIIGLLLLAGGSTFAQDPGNKPKVENAQTAATTFWIKGVVKADDDGTPLVGASVYVKGTTVGMLAGSNGEFAFTEPLREGDVVVFSFIGYKTREHVVSRDSGTTLEIKMVVDDLTVLGALSSNEIYTKNPSRIGRFWTKVKNIF
jgi:hypothetical protein